jgi:hypothetical protein
MHSNKRDINRWKRRAKLRKNSLGVESKQRESDEQLIRPVDPLAPRTIRVAKLDGTVQIIEVKKQQ